MKYPVKATFYRTEYDQNDYGEDEESTVELVTIGTRIKTERFRDQLQGQVMMDGDRQYVYARKTKKTSSIVTGDRIRIAKSNKEYRIIAVDSMYSNKSELMFLIDAEVK